MPNRAKSSRNLRRIRTKSRDPAPLPADRRGAGLQVRPAAR
jgi:hypothetical protein